MSLDDSEIAGLYDEFTDKELDELEGETCAEGFSEDEWCEPQLRLGVEYCEFRCPFGRIDAVYRELEEKRGRRTTKNERPS